MELEPEVPESGNLRWEEQRSGSPETDLSLYSPA